MTDHAVSVVDETHGLQLTVEQVEEGRMLRIVFPVFDGIPMYATLTVPRRHAVKALRKFIVEMYADEDVLANLLEEATKQLPLIQ